MLRFVFRLIILVIFLAVGYLGFGYYYYQKGVYRDLGIKYQMADYQAAIKKLKVNIEDPSKLYYGVLIKGQGESRIDDVFTENEITALINITNKEHGPFRNVQVRLLDGNNFEFSSYYNGGSLKLVGPVFIRGALVKAEGDNLIFRFDSIKAGDFNIPKIATTKLADDFNLYIKDVIGNMDVFAIDNLSISRGKADFKGLIPYKIEGK